MNLHMSLPGERLNRSLRDESIRRRICQAYEHTLLMHFNVTFYVKGGRGSREIVWDMGPREKDVWAFIFEQMPDLAQEVLSVAWESKSTSSSEVSFPLPKWLHRVDFYSSSRLSPLHITYLKEIGGDPNAIDEDIGLTPLEAAIASQNDSRAVSLVEIGARFPQDPDKECLENISRMPAFFALYEEWQLDRISSHPSKIDARQPRL